MRPLPHAAHRKFVEAEGWTKTGTSRGSGKTGDHHRYNLTLTNGDVLTTRVSHGPGQMDDPKVVAAILRDQLAVSEENFWRCVDGGILPPRPQPVASEPAGEVLDAKLARNLIRKAGMTEEEVGQLSKAEAVSRWQQYLADGGA